MKMDIEDHEGYTPLKIAVFEKQWSVVWLIAGFQSALR